ncbi:DNA-binding protein [Aeromonas sp. 75A]|uniref:DNA-binding protein n=1 Tax=unclassified Aeromonas TaxID=257493 RepID=UPI002E7C4D8C|nr:DNA-binding protein [Aeromonas sp. 43P]MEE1952244.1 DNA-binding protein [Aeromonas sp. 43P]
MNDKTQPTVGASGLYLVGEIAGVKQDTFRNGDSQIIRHTAGVRVTTVDAYGGEISELVEVRLPQAAVDAGLPRQLEGLRGQTLSLPVWVQAYTGRRGAGHALMLDSKQQILGI